MSEQKLAAELRTEFGKGAARRARRAALIPAVIYGHGEEPIHIVLPERETIRAVRGANALLSLDVAGVEHLALVKDIQRDPLLQIIEHIDLLTVKQGEKVIVDIPVVLVGEPVPGVVINQEENTVSLEAEATHVPVRLEADISGRVVGEHIHAGDLALPANVTLLTDAAQLIVHVAEANTAAEAEPAPAAVAAAE